MQKIFYNATFLTLSDENETADAMLVNDDSIVFVGSSDEVLQMKTDETELVDLNKSFVMPTFFDLNLKVYTAIEQRLKNANKDNFIEKINEKDENYEIFENFEVYKAEFLKVQNDILKRGITTIHEYISSREEFVFWKKISESLDLKIDVIGYIDFVKNKQIMDDNCRSYRKYKNHFRLGGYYVNLDGSILDKHAWVKKPYPKEKGFSGYSELGYEQLSFIIKTALEEKKQLIVKAGGDRAVEEFVLCYEEYVSKNKVEDNFRPMILGCNFVNKKLLEKIKNLNLICNFEIDNLTDNRKVLKSYFGMKLKKLLPLKTLSKQKLNFVLSNSSEKFFDMLEVVDEFQNKQKSLFLNKSNCFDKQQLLDTLILKPAYYSFDLEQKGSFESGKRATFLVFDKDVFENEQNINQANLISIYSNGEKIYEKK